MTKAKQKGKIKAVIRICACEGCKNKLGTHQKRYCCKECLNKDLSTGKSAHRPTKYKREFATTKLFEYIKYCEDEFKKYVRYEKYPVVLNHIPSYKKTKKEEREQLMAENEKRIEDSIIVNPPLPSIVGYCRFHKVLPKTIYNWAETHEEMQEALDYILSEQELWLLQNGLVGRYTPVYGKLILTNKHEYVERKENLNKNLNVNAVVRDLYLGADKYQAEQEALLREKNNG